MLILMMNDSMIFQFSHSTLSVKEPNADSEQASIF